MIDCLYYIRRIVRNVVDVENLKGSASESTQQVVEKLLNAGDPKHWKKKRVSVSVLLTLKIKAA